MQPRDLVEAYILLMTIFIASQNVQRHHPACYRRGLGRGRQRAERHRHRPRQPERLQGLEVRSIEARKNIQVV